MGSNRRKREVTLKELSKDIVWRSKSCSHCPSVLQDDGLTGAGGQQGHDQGTWRRRQLDPDREVRLPRCSPHLRLGQVFPQCSGVLGGHKHHWIRSLSLVHFRSLDNGLGTGP